MSKNIFENNDFSNAKIISGNKTVNVTFGDDSDEMEMPKHISGQDVVNVTFESPKNIQKDDMPYPYIGFSKEKNNNEKVVIYKDKSGEVKEIEIPEGVKINELQKGKDFMIFPEELRSTVKKAVRKEHRIKDVIEKSSYGRTKYKSN